MWKLYDSLIKTIPLYLKVDESLCRNHWTMVRYGENVGLSINLSTNNRPRTLPESVKNMGLRELAEFSKSWNFDEAALGMAAINSFWNSTLQNTDVVDMGDSDSFSHWEEHIKGKKVAIIGHLPYLEQKISEIAELSVVKKRPEDGDYLDSDYEFLLPRQNYIFATDVTLVNKTLPHLLELSHHCRFILSGPSVPLSPVLFDYGVADLQGFIVTDVERCREVISSQIYRPGNMFRLGVGKRVSLMDKLQIT